MYNNGNFQRKEDKHGYQRILVILVFLAGILNSQSFFVLMGFNSLYYGVTLIYYGLLGFMCIILILNFLYKKKGFALYSIPYWGILVATVIFKFIILFIQFPNMFLPGEVYFSSLITFAGNFLLMIILIKNIHSLYYIRAVIWALGIGCSLSSIIPLLFYPELIGTRISIVNGYNFSGAFWNSSVISYISVAWLLIAISSGESSRIKKNMLFGIFILIVIGCLAGLSRSALISIFLSVIVYLIASNKFAKFLKVVVMLCFLSIGLFYIYPEIIENFQERLDTGVSIEDESRTIIWKDYIEDIPNYFLLGDIEGNYKKYSVTGQPPHSVFLNWLSQFGIFALLGFLVLLVGILKSINTIRESMSKQIAAGLYAWFVAYLSVAMINETGFNHLTIFGAFGVILAWGKQVKKK